MLEGGECHHEKKKVRIWWGGSRILGSREGLILERGFDSAIKKGNLNKNMKDVSKTAW